MCNIVLLLAFVICLLAIIEGARCNRMLALQILAATWLAAFLRSPGTTPSAVV